VLRLYMHMYGSLWRLGMRLSAVSADGTSRGCVYSGFTLNNIAPGRTISPSLERGKFGHAPLAHLPSTNLPSNYQPSTYLLSRAAAPSISTYVRIPPHLSHRPARVSSASEGQGLG